MTDMKRASISFTDEIVAEIEKLKTSEEFKGRSTSEIVRRLILRGLASVERGEG